ncbi:MAG: nitronate monooxygenase [Chloroflexi bacterium]|nr:nitronate monooxygenase [Chloroflexota bacterium]
MLRTKLCDMLGIEYPILSAGMSLAFGDLAAAVSEAGGMGFIGTGQLTPDELRSEIKKVKSRTKKPFGCAISFPARDSEGTGAKLPEKLPEPIVRLRRELEEKGIDLRPFSAKTTSYTPEEQMEKFRIVLEEGVPAIALGRGVQQFVVKEAHAKGMVVISLIGRAHHAKHAEAAGADIVVATGHEAGGHTGTITTLSLVPQVVDSVKIPVVAAGGIVDGRGIVAAFAMGAVGVWVGTRFIATPEAGASLEYKQRLLAAAEGDSVWSTAYDGIGHRHLRNRIMELWEGHEHEILPYPLQRTAMHPLMTAAREHNLVDYMPLGAGQACGLIREMKSAGDVVREMAEEATRILKERLPGTVQVA